MRKIIMLGALFIFTASSSFAQGWVNLRTAGLGDSARVREAEGFSGAGFGLGNASAGVANGTNFLMQFYAGAGVVGNSSDLVPIGVPVNSRNGNSNNGFFQEAGTTTLGHVLLNEDVYSVLIPFVSPGGPLTLQLRAWYAGLNGNTYITFEAGRDTDDALKRFGASSLLYLSHTGNPLAAPPELPVGVDGLSGFQLVVPEPSGVGLVLLGLTSLAISRRRVR